MSRANGDGSVYFDKTLSKWRAAISWRDASNHLHRRTRVTTSKSEALNALHEMLANRDEDNARQQRQLLLGPTVGEYLADWEANVLPSLDIGASRRNNYVGSIRNHILPALGEIRVCELKPEHVESMFADLAERGLSKNTIILVRSVFSFMLNHAEKRGIIPRNPVRLSIIPASAREPKKRRTLNHEELKRFLAVIEGEKDEAFWTAAVLLGLRPGELAGLMWEDVDLEENVIHVVKARKKTALGYAIGTVKTQGSLRVLAMPDRLSEAMRRHRNNASGEGLVFPSRDGGIQHPGTVQGRLEKLCKLAGIDPPVVPYELRHTAASMLSDAGVPIEELADFMGHTTTAMLEQVYRHRVRKVIDVAKVFNPS